MPRYADDPQFMKLVKQYPNFPIEVLSELYRLDKTIDELKYMERESRWLKEKTEADRKKFEDKVFKELDKKFGEEGDE